MGDAFKEFKGVLPAGSFIGWDCSNVVSAYSMFQEWSQEVLDLTGLSFPNTPNCGHMFNNWYTTSNLTTIHFGNMSFEGTTTMTQNGNLNFYNHKKLTTLTGTVRFSKNCDIGIGHSPLTVESAMVIINGLPELNEEDDVRVVWLKKSTVDSLSEGQIAVCTSKGWTINPM